MANQPHPQESPKPAPPSKPPDDEDQQEAKTKHTKEVLELQKKQAGEPVETIADEQRKRSEEMQKEGVDKWMAERDNRPENERPRAVPGVAKDAPHGNERSGKH